MGPRSARFLLPSSAAAGESPKPTKDHPVKNSSKFTKLTALLLGLALTAAACASDDDTSAEVPAAEVDEATDAAMEDEDAMEDEMEDEAMADDAMSEGRPVITIDFEGLEPLGDDFEYELWTIVDGAPVTGGVFDIDDNGEVAISGDQDHLYGHEGATDVVISIEPADPGEDFLVDAPADLSFPLDLSGGAAVISVEPADDNSPAPFALKPLVGDIPADAEPSVNYDLGAGPAPFSASGSQV